MKIFSGRHCLLIGISTLALAGCSAPEANVSTEGAPQIAAVKCKRASDATLGTLIKKDCTSPSDATTVNKEEFLNALQTPGSMGNR
jgi:hypothetical protein